MHLRLPEPVERGEIRSGSRARHLRGVVRAREIASKRVFQRGSGDGDEPRVVPAVKEGVGGVGDCGTPPRVEKRRRLQKDSNPRRDGVAREPHPSRPRDARVYLRVTSRQVSGESARVRVRVRVRTRIARDGSGERPRERGEFGGGVGRGDESVPDDVSEVQTRGIERSTKGGGGVGVRGAEPVARGGFGAGTAGDERVAEAIGREHLGEEGGRAARVGPVEVRASSLDDGEAEGEDEVGVLGETRAEVAE